MAEPPSGCFIRGSECFIVTTGRRVIGSSMKHYETNGCYTLGWGLHKSRIPKFNILCFISLARRREGKKEGKGGKEREEGRKGERGEGKEGRGRKKLRKREKEREKMREK